LHLALHDIDVFIEKHPAVYLLASRYRGTLYVGVTSALYTRICDHKNGRFEGFSKNYHIHNLVWYAHYHTMAEAIRREKQMKAWKRNWKFELIEMTNPNWRDLHNEIDVLATLVEPQAGPQRSLG
jgi:putative endonuclease